MITHNYHELVIQPMLNYHTKILDKEQTNYET